MHPFRKILVYVDSRAVTDLALDRAVALATRAGGSVHVLHCEEGSTTGSGMGSDGRVLGSEPSTPLIETSLAKLVGARASPPIAVTVERLENTARVPPARQIVERVVADGFDLVIKTARGLSSELRALGMTARDLLRYCPCPVWVVRPWEATAKRRVLAAIATGDGGPAHEALRRRILEVASYAARCSDAELHVLHAWSIFGEQMLERRMAAEDFADLHGTTEARVRERLAEAVDAYVELPPERIHLFKGDPQSVVHAFVRRNGFDLVVMGSDHRGGLEGWISDGLAESILPQLPCSLLVVKPEETSPQGAR